MANTNFPPRNRPVGLEGVEPEMLEVIDTQLGRRQRITRNGPAVSVLQPVGRSQHAKIATVHVQVSVPDEAYAERSDNRAPIVGLLQWGQGGASFTAEVDLRNGTTFTLAASTIALNARFEADTDEDTRAAFADVAAAVTWGTRGGRQQPTRTLPRVTLANGTSVTFPVPAFAYAVQFYVNSNAFYLAAATSVITLHEGPAVTDDPELVILSGTLGPSYLTQEGIALSGNTRFVTLQNNNGADIIVRPTFMLAL